MELTTPLRYEPLDNAEVASERLRFFQTPVLLQYWRSLLRHKWIVASILLGCLILGLVLTLMATPVYTATSRVEISRQQENITNVEGLQREETGQSLEFYQTQYSLLESKTLAERVARALNLANDEQFAVAFGLDEDDGTREAGTRRAANATDERFKAVYRLES